jgi:hypothetical protein
MIGKSNSIDDQRISLQKEAALRWQYDFLGWL